MPSLIVAWFAVDQREHGATSVEYALLASLVAGVIIVAVTALGLQVNALYQFTLDALP